MDLKETGLKGAECIHVVQNSDKWRASINTGMNFRVPQNAGKFFTV